MLELGRDLKLRKDLIRLRLNDGVGIGARVEVRSPERVILGKHTLIGVVPGFKLVEALGRLIWEDGRFARRCGQ